MDGRKKEPRPIITTALLNDRTYHFCGVERDFHTLAQDVGVTFDYQLIQIALPQLYKHQPLHNVLLYHELGHFIDQEFKVATATAHFLDSVDGPWADLKYSREHFAEFFCDLFATSYVGDTVAHMLTDLAPNEPECDTHPATADRLKLIKDMLAGQVPPVLALANIALDHLGLPALTTRFQLPNITECFDNMLPFPIGTDAEVHGLLPAARSYLYGPSHSTSPMWANLKDVEKSRIVNDLVEKSIRSYMVRKRWNDACSH